MAFQFPLLHVMNTEVLYLDSDTETTRCREKGKSSKMWKVIAREPGVQLMTTTLGRAQEESHLVSTDPVEGLGHTAVCEAHPGFEAL